MAYSILSLPPPGRGRLNKASSSVFNPLSKQIASPVPAPAYSDLVKSLAQGNIAPEFQATGATQFSPALPSLASAPSVAMPQGDTSGSPASGGAPVPSLGTNAANNPIFKSFEQPQFQGTSIEGLGDINYADDPILQQVQAQVEANDKQAQAAALANERTALIRFGSGDLLAQVLGDQSGDGNADAANNNSFGTVQELGRWNDRSLSGIDSAANRNNLYFSSTRLKDRGLQQEDYGRQTAKTSNQLQDVLTGIAQGLLSNRQNSQAQLLAAMEAAYQRALQLAMWRASQVSGGGGGGGPALPTDTSAEIPPSAYTYQTDPQKTIQWWLNNPNPFWRPGGYVRSGAVNSGRVGFG